MFRFIFIILLQYTTITSVFSASVSQYDNSSTYLNCSYSAEVDIIRTFKEDLEAVRNRTDEIEIVRKRLDEIGTEISLIQKQLQANRKSKPSSCIEAAAGSFSSGIYEIQLEKFGPTPFAVWCNEDIEHGGWLVFQRRESDAVDFNRGWQDYKDGFGIPNGNYWLGLEKLHVLTTSCQHELYIEMINFDGVSYYAKYSDFVIGSESEGYALKNLGSYEGAAGKCIWFLENNIFSTFDRDNDKSETNIAGIYKSGWWFYNEHYCNLNGVYKKEDEKVFGVTWNGDSEHEAWKFVQMMIRPTENCLTRMLLMK